MTGAVVRVTGGGIVLLRCFAIPLALEPADGGRVLIGLIMGFADLDKALSYVSATANLMSPTIVDVVV